MRRIADRQSSRGQGFLTPWTILDRCRQEPLKQLINPDGPCRKSELACKEDLHHDKCRLPNLVGRGLHDVNLGTWQQRLYAKPIWAARPALPPRQGGEREEEEEEEEEE